MPFRKMWIDPAHEFLLRKRLFRWRGWHGGKGRDWISVTNTDLEKVADGVLLPRRLVVDTHLEEASDKSSMGDRIHREALVAKSLTVHGPKLQMDVTLAVVLRIERISGSLAKAMSFRRFAILI